MKKIAFIAPIFFLFACGGNEETKVEKDYVETEYDKQVTEYLADKSWKDEVERLDDGLYIYTEKAGSEEKPSLQDFVTINYKGMLLNGEVFDGTEGQPATFQLNGLIKGWQEGIPHFGKGGKGTLIIPPELGYGVEGSGPIPPKSVLVFEIELLDFSSVPPMPPVVKDADYSEDIKAYMAKNGLKGAEETESGLFIITENAGGEEKPKLTDFLTLKYEGRLTDGSKFDGTDGNAITFPFPMHQLIPGWQEGIPKFGKGGKGTLIIPPYLGYGDREIEGIPAKSILVFDVELVDFSDTPPPQENLPQN
ncbi:MAG: FKBP-type peptidyl-prolyl cis-trans isomerase [Putridiphycobacter sp.]